MVTVTGHFSPLFLYGNTMKQRLQIERGTSAVFLRYEMGGAANLQNISEFFWDVVDLLGLHLPFTVQMNWNTAFIFFPIAGFQGEQYMKLSGFVTTTSRWFKVAFLSNIWRSLSLLKGHFTIPKGSERIATVGWCVFVTRDYSKNFGIVPLDP